MLVGAVAVLPEVLIGRPPLSVDEPSSDSACNEEGMRGARDAEVGLPQVLSPVGNDMEVKM